jgi:hypothetical protein
MTQVVKDVESGSDVRQMEDRLWTEYVIARVRSDECQRLADAAWRERVLADDESKWSKSDMWHHCVQMCGQAREAANAAYVVWQRVAYPMGGFPPPDEDESSSE